MLDFLLLLLSPLLALTGMSTNTTKQASQVNYAFTASCWNPETGSTDPGSQLTVTAAMLDGVHANYPTQPVCHGSGTPFNPYGGGDGLISDYTRISQNMRITKLKVDQEGKPFSGGCGLSGSAIRLVGKTTDGQNIFWEDKNYVGQKLFDLVFVEAYPPDNKAHYFDVYARNSIIADPTAAGYGSLLECKTTGGIVPVVEKNSDELPPQVVSFTEIDKTDFENNYNRFATPVGVTQAPGSIGPTIPPTAELFPPYVSYLVKVDVQAVPDAALSNGQIGRVIHTSKGITYVYDVFFHAGSFYLRDQSDGSSYNYEASDTAPPSGVDVRNPSLQLGVLAFRVQDTWNPFVPVCKPAIYLYPTKPTQLSVKVVADGYLTKSIPDYGDGWNVTAEPDGRIQALGTRQQAIEYPYLYYEANIRNINIPKEGWVIERSNIKNKISKILALLGLNEKESQDFLSYWVPKLSEKPYYFVTLLSENVLNEKEKLIFSQNPDTLIRVRFIFEGLDTPVSVAPLALGDTPKRVGFTAVDWGGGVVGGNCESGIVKDQKME